MSMSKSSGEDGWRSFLNLCAQVKTTSQLDELLGLFLTHEERSDLADRYLIIRELVKGEKTQREMAQDLSVSIATITRGSNSVKMIGENLRNFLMQKIK